MSLLHRTDRNRSRLHAPSQANEGRHWWSRLSRQQPGQRSQKLRGCRCREDEYCGPEVRPPVRPPREQLHRGSCKERGPCCRSEEHTSELQSLMRNSYSVFCLNKQKE